MPTVRQYSDSTGLYLRSNIDGQFITHQLTPAAEGLLKDLGYTGEEDDQITWTLVHPLLQQGHVYTKKNGVEATQDAIDEKLSTSSDTLSLKEKQRVNEFLERHTPDGEDNTQNTDGTTKKEALAKLDGLESHIKRWSPTSEEYDATLDRLTSLNDIEAIRKSLAHHGSQLPLEPTRFYINSRGIPVYSFDTNEIPWVVHDFRTIREPTIDEELYLEVKPGKSSSQSITIKEEIVEWHTSADRFSDLQLDDIVATFPDIWYYVHHLPSSPQLGKLNDNATAVVPESAQDRIKALDGITPIEPNKTDRVCGIPISLGPKGYGRIRTHTGHTFPFSKEEFKDSDIEVGDIVSLEVKNHRSRVYAFNIHREHEEPSPSRFLRLWPNWRNWSMERVQSHWEEVEWDSELKEEEIGNNSGLSRYDFSKNGQESQTVQVEVDPLQLFLAKEDDPSKQQEEIIDEACRKLLKDVIDEDIPSMDMSSETQSIELIMPTNLLTIIETSVSTTDKIHSLSHFFNTALQRHHGITCNGSTELVFRVPGGYFATLERLANEKDTTTAELGREILAEGVRKEMRGRAGNNP